jgi:hypothetical protein
MGSGRVQNIIQIIGAFAAMIAAAVTLSAYVFSNPHDFNLWRQRTFDGYSVTIDKPGNNAPVGGAIEVRGTAHLPPEWNLVVLVQTPDEQKYYIVSGGAVTVDNNHIWDLKSISIGSTNPKQHAQEVKLNQDYKIVALLVDEEGQLQVETGLSRPGAWMPSLPHNAAMAIRKVHLSS